MQFIAITQQYFGSDSILDHRSGSGWELHNSSFLGVDKKKARESPFFVGQSVEACTK